MNKKAKIIKPKKKFNWSKIAPYFKSLYNNQVATELGLTKKWYVALIVALISVIISLIPTTVSAATAKGSAFLNTSANYNYDEGFYSFLEDAKNNNYDLTFDETTHESKLTGITTSAANNYLLYNHKILKSDGAIFSDFQVYYIDSKNMDSHLLQNTIETIVSSKVNSLDGRDCSFLIFTSNTFITRLYKPKAYNAVGGVYGDFTNLSKEQSKLSNLFVSKSQTRLENVSETLNNFKGFVDNVYINTRKTVALTQTGIIGAVNAGIVLLMGFVLFLLTRGKNNPNRGIKFQQCFNIAYWTTLSPALIALVVGFIVSAYQVMLFVIVFGFRTMWLSMKTLSPNNPPVVKK